MNEDKRILARMVKHIQTMPDDPFTPLYDEYLIRRLDRDAPRLATWVDLRPRFRPGKRLSPSSIGGCKRAAVFQFAGIRGHRRVDPRSESIFETGDWYHHKWQSIFRDMELVLGSDRIKVGGIEEQATYPKLYIMGYLDLRVQLPVDGVMRWITVDVKSINDRGFRAVSDAGEPLPSHKKQVTTYCRAAKTRYGAVLYENKDNSEHLFYLFEYDKSLWAEVRVWCQDVLGALGKKKLPQRHEDCQQGNFEYERCPHKKLCYGRLDRVQLRQMVYKDFPGVDALWKEGIEDEQAEEARQEGAQGGEA